MKKHGIYSVLAAIAIQLTLGIAYIWSVFQTGMADSLFSGNNADAALTFSILLATLTVGSVLGGKLAVKYSTRLVVLIGGIILSAGFFLAAFVTKDFAWLLWVTYGAMGGVGMGFTYSTTIACAQKWYPHKKGLVTGIIVASLGLGGVVFTPIIKSLVKTFDGETVAMIKENLEKAIELAKSPEEVSQLIETASKTMQQITNLGEFGEFKTFMVLSAIFLVVCVVGSLFMQNPPEGYMSTGSAAKNAPALKVSKDYSAMEMLRTPEFYLLTGSFLLAVIGGLMVIGFAEPIAKAKGLASTAVFGVLAVSMFNSVGRLVWGMVSDKLGRRNTIMILLLGTTVIPLFVLMAESFWLYVLIGAVGFFYGGFLSTYPSLTADLFGAKHMATNYGVVLLGFGGGAIISSQIAGYYKDLAKTDISLMFPAFVISACCAAVSIAMVFALKMLSKKKKQQAEENV